MSSIQETAKEASSYFTGLKRNDNEEIRILKDGAPEWVTDLIHKAHGDMLPDDYRFAIIEEALDAIAESEDLDETESEYVDNVDIYTKELTTWLGSRTDRYGWVDAGIEEYGKGDSITNDLENGQRMERREVFALVRRALESVSEEAEA